MHVVSSPDRDAIHHRRENMYRSRRDFLFKKEHFFRELLMTKATLMVNLHDQLGATKLNLTLELLNNYSPKAK